MHQIWGIVHGFVNFSLLFATHEALKLNKNFILVFRYVFKKFVELFRTTCVKKLWNDIFITKLDKNFHLQFSYLSNSQIFFYMIDERFSHSFNYILCSWMCYFCRENIPMSSTKYLFIQVNTTCYYQTLTTDRIPYFFFSSSLVCFVQSLHQVQRICFLLLHRFNTGCSFTQLFFFFERNKFTLL